MGHDHDIREPSKVRRKLGAEKCFAGNERTSGADCAQIRVRRI
jgi:hypothetical protein